MTVGQLVLKKSQTLLKYPSPPEVTATNTFKRRKSKFPHIKCKVDATSPTLDANLPYRHLKSCANKSSRILEENLKLLKTIMHHHFVEGKVDSHWKNMPQEIKLYYYKRKNFWDQISKHNVVIYRLLKNTQPKIITTKDLENSWKKNKADILDKAQKPFILFPLEDLCEDVMFLCPDGVKRPRVLIEIKIKDWYTIGSIQVELFTDVCPKICALFLELLAGHPKGFGYVGTTFHRKVPNLYWSGGDVAYNNGFGCYAQKGLAHPITAENYYFLHSMPGLLSMRVTQDNEVCGIFNITFKPLPQFNFKNVVFGRVIRPSKTWNKMKDLGSTISSHPCVEISGSRFQKNGKWHRGVANCKKNSKKIDTFVF